MNRLNSIFAGLFCLVAFLAGAPQAQAQTTTVEYLHTDALGTPVAVTDAAGAVIERSEYEPYGQLVNRPLTDGPGFTGHVQDAATGLTYMQQRYYDPTIGRFLSVDPVTAYSNPVGAFNRYWYANNNPYKFNDPDGRVVEYAFKNGATPGDGDAILRHIQKSPTAMSELAQIANSDLTYTVSFNRGQGMSYDRETRTVNIDVTSGLKVKSSGKIQSAALGGVHEISHGAQHDRIGTKALERNLEAPVTGEMQNGVYTVKVGISVEEARATKVESKAAKELGEPARKNYHDQSGPVRTCSPTSNKQC
jgi:RHS repeat-associated protein